MEQFGRRSARGNTAAGKGGAGGRGWTWIILKNLLFSYILTAAMLLLLALLLYKFGLTEKTVSIAIIVIYVAATFFAGFFTGRKMENRRFLWGLLMGTTYFVVLAVVSLIVNRSPETLGNSFFTTMVLCGAGGTLGGMLS